MLILILFFSIDCFVVAGALFLTVPYVDNTNHRESLYNWIGILILIGVISLITYTAFLLDKKR